MVVKGIGIPQKSNVRKSIGFSPERLINFYYEGGDENTKSAGVIYGTAGLKLFSNISTDPVYGLYQFQEILFAVIGNNVYRISAGAAYTLLGSIGNVSSNVIMADNGIQLVILKDEGDAYVATQTSLVQITDPDFQSASSVTELNGYMIFTKKDSNQYFISGLLDALTYDASEFASAEDSPDNLVRAFSCQGQLWLFGKLTTEIHYDAGNTDFPFVKIGGATMQRGCAAKRSVASDDNTLFWLGDDLIIYRANGYVPQPISTAAVNTAISSYGNVSDADGFIYTEEGHKFYCLTFPAAKATWVFDITTGLFHERQSFEKDRWRVNVFARVFDKNIVGDFETGKLYELDVDTHTDDGQPIQGIIISPIIALDKKRINFYALWLDMEVGIGLIDGQGSSPQMMLQYSDDGGYTYSYELWESMGDIGDRMKEVIWRRLGQSRARVFKILISDPVKRAVYDLKIDVGIGNA